MYNIYKNENKYDMFKGIILSILVYGLLFENVLEKYIPLLGNIDEVVGVVIIVLGIIKILMNREDNLILKNSYKILLSVGILIVIGLAGNLIYGYQYMQYALKDILTLRGILCYAMIPIVFSDFEIDDYSQLININLKIITVVLFVFTVLNLFIDIFPYYEIRFGMKSQQLIFTHPTYLATTGTLIIAMLSGFLSNDKKNYIYIGLMYFVVLMTLRTKAIMFLIAYIYLLVRIGIGKNKLTWIDIAILLIIGLGVGVSEIREYLQNPDWARSAMALNSIDIAKNHFPFGSGFGSFGNWISGANYSPLYYTYGMQTTWGLAPDYFNFVADNFWPMITAQFGFIGLGIIVYIIFKVYINISLNDDIYKYFGQMTVLACLISSSMGEASFTGPYAVVSFLIIGLFSKSSKSNIGR